MNIVFILRSEVVCIAILLYLFFFSLRYSENEQKGRFLQMCICALGHVICDLNDLKITNDRYGHMEGDELIRLTAHLLSTYMRHAYRIYRIGGDEFVALYLDEKLPVVKEEIRTVRRECRNVKTASGVPLSIAIGMALSEDGERISEIAKAADERMYLDKSRIKGQI